MHGLVPHDPASPSVAPSVRPGPLQTNVTDNGWNLGAGDAGPLGCVLPGVAVGNFAGPVEGPFSRPCATCGSVAAAATITAAPPAALIALTALRLRARR